MATEDSASELIIIRPVVRADFARWLPLWEGYNAFYGRVGGTALPADVTRTTWERFLDPREPMHALVAKRAEELLGLAHYVFHRSTTLATETCYLQDLFTAPASRRRGTGGRLIASVCEEARLAGAQRVYWHTHESNAQARKLYEKLVPASGFIVYRVSIGNDGPRPV